MKYRYNYPLTSSESPKRSNALSKLSQIGFGIFITLPYSEGVHIPHLDSAISANENGVRNRFWPHTRIPSRPARTTPETETKTRTEIPASDEQ